MNETVTTWADAYGRWHARVDFQEGGSPVWLDYHRDRIRAKARRAIRREIEARQADPVGRTRIEVAANRLDQMNRMTSITYREKD